MTFLPGVLKKEQNKTKNLICFFVFWLFFEITPVCRKQIQNQYHPGMSNFCQFSTFWSRHCTFFRLFLRYTEVISKNRPRKSAKSELVCPILVRKNGK